MEITTDRPRSGQEHFPGSRHRACRASCRPARRCGGRRCCRSLPSCRRAWSAWKRAAHRIIGRARLTKLGHEVRLMPPAYVKPYVKRGKTDASDAEAICEAVTRPTMRFVPMKSAEQQAALALHRTRDLLVRQRTQLVNMIRGLLAEFGIEMARGLHHALDAWRAGSPPARHARGATAGAARGDGTGGSDRRSCRSSSPSSRRSCWPGTARTSCRSVWRRSRASA